MLTDDELQELFALQWYWGAHYVILARGRGLDSAARGRFSPGHHG